VFANIGKHMRTGNGVNKPARYTRKPSAHGPRCSCRSSFSVPQTLQAQRWHLKDIWTLTLGSEELPIVSGHKEVVGMLAIDCRQVGEEVGGIRFHPPDLAGEERQSIYANAQGSSPWGRSWPASCGRSSQVIILLLLNPSSSPFP
jgi:hypothetical protein